MSNFVFLEPEGEMQKKTLRTLNISEFKFEILSVPA